MCKYFSVSVSLFVSGILFWSDGGVICLLWILRIDIDSFIILAVAVVVHAPSIICLCYLLIRSAVVRVVISSVTCELVLLMSK